MRAQVSTELMIVIAAILVIFIPLILTVYFKTNEANEQLAQVQAEIASTRLANLINAVGNLGENSSITGEVFIPPNVKRVSFRNLGRGGEIIVKIDTSSGETDIVDVVRFPLQPLEINDPTQGLKRFDISYNGRIIIARPV